MSRDDGTWDGLGSLLARSLQQDSLQISLRAGRGTEVERKSDVTAFENDERSRRGSGIRSPFGVRVVRVGDCGRGNRQQVANRGRDPAGTYSILPAVS